MLLCRQRLIHLINNRIHLIAEQLMHPADAALAVKRGVIQTILFDVHGADNVLLDCANRQILTQKLRLKFRTPQQRGSREEKLL